MTTIFAREALDFWLLLLLSLQFVAIVANAEMQRHQHRQLYDGADVNYDSNNVSPYQRAHQSSYRRGDATRKQYDAYDANNQQNYRQSATSDVQQRLQRKQQQDQGPETQDRGLLRSNEISMGKNKCQIWVPSEIVGKYPFAQIVQMDKTNNLQLIQICCTGYTPMRLRSSTYCWPVCENCRNGHCVGPDECECFDHFVANDNGDCVFACPLDCLNGRCFLDGTCQCNPGYKLDETRKFCRPICSSGCGMNPRHNCTEPEVCGCAKGYQLTDDGCQPVCDPECGEGGECREPNECHCTLPGYTLKDGVCQRDCYQKCDNGICYNTNRCICNPGYTYHEQSTLCVLN